MRNKLIGGIALAAIVAPAQVWPQDGPLTTSAVSVKFPTDSPIVFVDATTGESRTAASGAALLIDLHLSLVLRNIGTRRVHSVKLGVVAQEVALGGKGSQSYTGMNVGPGETFPVRIDTQLMKPFQGGGPLVEVRLEGVLFDDLTFYGNDPNAQRLAATQRAMTAWELEARRDREYFRRTLAQSGVEGLKQAIFASLERQRLRPRLDLRMPSGPAVTSATLGSERAEKFAFLQFRDAPVEAIGGWAEVAGNQMRSPRIEVRNLSSKPVKYVELGWLVRDESGEQYMAASLPASGPDLYLPAGRTTQVVQDKVLDLSRSGRPLKIQGMTGFVSQVQFADGQIWVPSRQNLDEPTLRKVLPPSLEEQRLTDIYRTKGRDALLLELKR
jgi:hypothetical protein